jgi:peptide/nickel transport system permease protein
MRPLWRLLIGRVLQAAFSLAIFVYVIATVADGRFTAMDWQEIRGKAIQAAGQVTVRSDPPLTLEEGEALVEQLTTQAAKAYGLDKHFLIRVHLRVVRLLTQGLGEMPYPTGFGVVRPGTGGDLWQVSFSVGDMLLHAAVPTLLLFFGAFLAQIAIAYYLGLWCARRPGSRLDRATTLAGYLGTCVPPIVAAGTVMTVFVYALRIFPGDIWIFRWPSGWANVGPWLADFLSYYTLPFLTIVVLGFGLWAIQFRNIVLMATSEDFVDAARARGLSERRVIYGHVARASAPPLVTAMVMGLATSVFASFFVEPLFRWPGLGTLFWRAVESTADRLIFGIMLVTGVFFVVAAFALELVYGFLDPRIKTQAAGRR